ncbi:MAG: methyl-accepting chemotaxis protein [Myxococcota bacterium]
MDLNALLRASGVNQPANRTALRQSWEGVLGPAIRPILNGVYAACAQSPLLKDFLWGQDERTWVQGQVERWQPLFFNGVDRAHLERVRGFGRGDAESGMNVGVYGLFFSTVERSMQAHLMRCPHINDETRLSYIEAIDRLLWFEVNLAVTCYNAALREQSAAAIQKITDFLMASVEGNVSEVASSTAGLVEGMTRIQTNSSTNLDRANDISHSAACLTDQIQALRDSIGSIQQLLAEITSIAMQTNLLSLNASIEAARAGVAGRSFAVVASEVQNLAERSRGTAEKISSNTERLQKSITNVEQTFGAVSDKVAVMVEAIASSGQVAAKQKAATDAIAGRVRDVDTEIRSAISSIQAEHDVSVEALTISEPEPGMDVAGIDPAVLRAFLNHLQKQGAI